MTPPSVPPDSNHGASEPNAAAKPAPPNAPPNAAAILESYTRLQTVVEDYSRGIPEDDAQLRSLKSRIMTIVEQEVSRGPSAELHTPRGREYSMTLAALRAEVRAAVDAVPGFRARRVHLLAAEMPHGALDLRVTLVAAARSSITDQQDRLRADIAERLREAVEVRTGSIDLIVEDLFDD